MELNPFRYFAPELIAFVLYIRVDLLTFPDSGKVIPLGKRCILSSEIPITFSFGFEENPMIRYRDHQRPRTHLQNGELGRVRFCVGREFLRIRKSANVNKY